MKRHLAPAAAFVIAAALTCAAPLGAAPVVSISNPVVSGSTGYFDVVISNPGGAEAVSGYTIGVTVTRTGGTGGITFNDPNGAVEPANPLFAGSDPGEGFFENVFFASDALTAGSATATNGKGVFRATFAVEPNTAGTFNVDFFQSANHPLDARLEYLENDQTTRVAATFADRAIFIPEPAGIMLLLPAAAALLRRRCRRRVVG